MNREKEINGILVSPVIAKPEGFPLVTVAKGAKFCCIALNGVPSEFAYGKFLQNCSASLKCPSEKEVWHRVNHDLNEIEVN
jgi:hypothetical protein